MQFGRNCDSVRFMRRRPTTAAAFAVVVLVVGQLAALHHEAVQRHITCADHGELIDAPTPTSATAVDNCGHSHWVGIEGGSAEHKDCAISRAFHQSSSADHGSPTVAITATVATIDVVITHDVVVTSELYLIAPKTSPPA